MHRTTPEYGERLRKLPTKVQQIARRNFEFLKTNTQHPSLHFKKVGDFWSIRVGLNHRALAVEDEGDFVWVWIGSHDDYERIINTKR